MSWAVYRLRRAIKQLSGEHEGFKLRCIPSPHDPRDFKYSFLIPKEINLTSQGTIDYRNELPPAFDQQQRGSCVACASTWTLKAYEEIKQGDYPTQGLSAAFLYSMCKQLDGTPEEEGTYPRVAMKVLHKYGICPEDVLPYQSLSRLPQPQVPDISDQAKTVAGNYKINTYAQLCSSADYNRSNLLTTIRQALTKEGPIIMALLVCANFKPDQNNRLPIPAGQVLGGHAIGIAGDLPDQKALILRNSWGTGWGDKGYALLPYEWLTAKGKMGWYIFEAWTATDLAVNKPVSQI